MTKPRRPLPCAARSEDGFTLTEMLVAITITLIAFSSSLMVFNVAQESQPRISERGVAIQQGRVWIERLTRELRQGATMAGTATASSLSFLTYVRHSSCGSSTVGTSIQCRVTYTCTAGTCRRTEASPDGSTTDAPQETVTGLQSTNVFSYSPTPSAPEYIGVTLQFPASQESGETEDAVTLQDGVNLRNYPD